MVLPQPSARFFEGLHLGTETETIESKCEIEVMGRSNGLESCYLLHGIFSELYKEPDFNPMLYREFSR